MHKLCLFIYFFFFYSSCCSKVGEGARTAHSSRSRHSIGGGNCWLPWTLSRHLATTEREVNKQSLPSAARNPKKKYNQEGGDAEDGISFWRAQHFKRLLLELWSQSWLERSWNTSLQTFPPTSARVTKHYILCMWGTAQLFWSLIWVSSGRPSPPPEESSLGAGRRHDGRNWVSVWIVANTSPGLQAGALLGGPLKMKHASTQDDPPNVCMCHRFRGSFGLWKVFK